VIADAFSVWALMDIRNRRLLKVNEFEFGFSGDETLAVDLPRRVHFPVSLPVEEAGERTIRYADIDYNGHMNNTRYPDMLCDFLPNVFSKRVMGFTLSYLHEATYGHTLKVYRAETENGFLFRTVDGDGMVCLEAYMETEDRKDAKNV
jgi:acyl-ACP thioesterase